MVAWSSIALKSVFRGVISGSKYGFNKRVCINYVPVRKSGHERKMVITASKYEYFKMKDIIIFYFLLGAIPLCLLAAYVNIFIGPAELAEIPEGYEPKHWEYYSHPLERFFARYVLPNPQETYERTLNHVYKEGEKMHFKQLVNKIDAMMREKHDYQAWYFRDTSARFPRHMQKVQEEGLSDHLGHSGPGFMK